MKLHTLAAIVLVWPLLTQAQADAPATNTAAAPGAASPVAAGADKAQPPTITESAPTADADRPRFSFKRSKRPTLAQLDQAEAAAAAASTTPAEPAVARPVTLRRGVVMTFPPNVRTVLDAARYILTPMGYRVIVPAATYRETARILDRPVLSVHRNGALLPIDIALVTIGGDDTKLIVDHTAKLVTFEPYYQ